MPVVPAFSPSRDTLPLSRGALPATLDTKVDVPYLPPVAVDQTRMGLSPGLVLLARALHETGRPAAGLTDAGAIPLALANRLVEGTRACLAAPGAAERWLGATAALDHDTWFWGPGLYAETVTAAHAVMARVDAGELCAVGVVLAQSPLAGAVFDNQVVLAYGYDLVGTRLTLRVYDPGVTGPASDRDAVTITLELGSSAPAKPIRTNGTCCADRPGRIRGFFVLPLPDLTRQL